MLFVESEGLREARVGSSVARAILVTTAGALREGLDLSTHSGFKAVLGVIAIDTSDDEI